MEFSDKILEEYRSYGAYGGVELREGGEGGVEQACTPVFFSYWSVSFSRCFFPSSEVLGEVLWLCWSYVGVLKNFGGYGGGKLGGGG